MLQHPQAQREPLVGGALLMPRLHSETKPRQTNANQPIIIVIPPAGVKYVSSLNGHSCVPRRLSHRRRR